MSDGPDTRLSPLPGDVAALFDAERRRPPADEPTVARIAAGISARLDIAVLPPDGGGAGGPPPSSAGDGGAGAGGTGAAGAGGGEAASATAASATAASVGAGSTATAGLSAAVLSPVTLVAFGLGVAAGAGGLAALRPSAPPAAVVIQAEPSAEPSPGVVPMLPPPPPAAKATAQDSGSDRVARPRAKRPLAPRPSSAVERQLLEMARTALARGRAAAALTALGDHRKRFRRSQLAEEREALTVIALSKAGRAKDAEARAQRFRRRFPKSLLLPSVEAATRP